MKLRNTLHVTIPAATIALLAALPDRAGANVLHAADKTSEFGESFPALARNRAGNTTEVLVVVTDDKPFAYAAKGYDGVLLAPKGEGKMKISARGKAVEALAALATLKPEHLHAAAQTEIETPTKPAMVR